MYLIVSVAGVPPTLRLVVESFGATPLNGRRRARKLCFESPTASGTQPTKAHHARAWAAKPTGVEAAISFDSAGLPKERFFEPQRSHSDAHAIYRDALQPSDSLNIRAVVSFRPPPQTCARPPAKAPGRKHSPARDDARHTQHARAAAAHDSREGLARARPPPPTPSPETAKDFEERLDYVQKKTRQQGPRRP
jgi:hypothetical protein